MYGQGMHPMGHGAFRPAYLGIVARNHYYLGNADEALKALDDAMEQVRTSGELVHQPDLLRLRAEIIAGAHPDRMDEVVADLVAPSRSARAQGRSSSHCGRPTTSPDCPTTTGPTDWADRVRSVIDRFPPNSSSPELGAALRPSRSLTWRLPGGRWPFSAAAWPP